MDDMLAAGDNLENALEVKAQKLKHGTVADRRIPIEQMGRIT